MRWLSCLLPVRGDFISGERIEVEFGFVRLADAFGGIRSHWSFVAGLLQPRSVRGQNDLTLGARRTWESHTTRRSLFICVHLVLHLWQKFPSAFSAISSAAGGKTD